jgi:hypothetical protein
MPRRNVRANKARKGGRNSGEFDEWVASRMAPTIRPNPLPPPHPLPPPPPPPPPPPTPLGVFRRVPDAIMRLLFTFFSMSEMFSHVETLSTQFKKYVPEYRREVAIITTSRSQANNIFCLNVKVTRNTFFPPAISLADRNAWNISLGAMIVSKQLEYARENAYMRDKRIPLREDAIALSGYQPCMCMYRLLAMMHHIDDFMVKVRMCRIRGFTPMTRQDWYMKKACKALRVLSNKNEHDLEKKMKSIAVLIGPQTHTFFPSNNMFLLLGCNSTTCDTINDAFAPHGSYMFKVEYTTHVAKLCKELRKKKSATLSECFNYEPSRYSSHYDDDEDFTSRYSCNGEGCSGPCNSCGILICGCIDTCRCGYYD